MDIWILVIVLLVIAVILLVLSLYNNDTKDVEKQLNEFTTQQSQEMYSIKSRLSELEKGYRENESDMSDQVNINDLSDYSEEAVIVAEDAPVEETTLAEVSDDTREEVIRLYSQGYTMHEIGHEVALNTRVIQDIIDDYIENR